VSHSQLALLLRDGQAELTWVVD